MKKELKTYLDLSVDKQWLRVFVDGKQVVSFHVVYGIKVTEPAKDTPEYIKMMEDIKKGSDI